MARDMDPVSGRAGEPFPAGQPALPPAAPLWSSGAGTFLDATSVFEGVIRSSEPMRLDGRVKGEIHCEDSVAIGQSAHIDATIRADSVAIAGEVRGSVHAARKIALTATARVVGDLTTPAISIEDGAELVGRAQIGARAKSDPQADKKAPAPARPATAPAPPTA